MAIKSVGIDGCVQGGGRLAAALLSLLPLLVLLQFPLVLRLFPVLGAVLWSVGRMRRRVNTFVQLPIFRCCCCCCNWWAVPLVCLPACLCVPVCCCVGGLLSESGGGFVVLFRVRDSQWVCVCELKWPGYTSIFIWRHNWYWRTMLPSRCSVRLHWEKCSAHLFTFIAKTWLMWCLLNM